MSKEYAILSLAALLVISGCTGITDVTPLVQDLPQVQEFLADNPNAEINVAVWGSDVVAANIDEIRAQCGEQMEIKDYWRAEITDVTINTNLIMWIDRETQEPLCVIRNLIVRPEIPRTTTTTMSDLPSVPTTSTTTTTISRNPPKSFTGTYVGKAETGENYEIGEEVDIYFSNSGDSDIHISHVTISIAGIGDDVYQQSLDVTVPAQSSILVFNWNQKNSDGDPVSSGTYSAQLLTPEFGSGQWFRIGPRVTATTIPRSCGNSLCESTESYSTCPADCTFELEKLEQIGGILMKEKQDIGVQDGSDLYIITLNDVRDANSIVLTIGNETKSISKGTSTWLGGLQVTVEDVFWYGSTRDDSLAYIFFSKTTRTTTTTLPGTSSGTRLLTQSETINVLLGGISYDVTLNDVTDAETIVLTVGAESKSVNKGVTTTIGGLQVTVEDVYWYGSTRDDSLALISFSKPTRTTTTTIPRSCGNGICESTESYSTCPADCTFALGQVLLTQGQTIVVQDGSKLYEVTLNYVIGDTNTIGITIDSDTWAFGKGVSHAVGGLQVTVDDVYFYGSTRTDNQALVSITELVTKRTLTQGATINVILNGITYHVTLNDVRDANSIVVTVGPESVSATKGESLAVGGLQVTVEDVYWYGSTRDDSQALVILREAFAARRVLTQGETVNMLLDGKSHDVTLNGVTDADTIVLTIGPETKSVQKRTTTRIGNLYIYAEDVYFYGSTRTDNQAFVIISEIATLPEPYLDFNLRTSIVVYGTNGDPADHQYCLDKLTYLGLPAKASFDVTDTDKATKNLILISAPFLNTLTQNLADTGKSASQSDWTNGLIDPHLVQIVESAFAANTDALIIAGPDIQKTQEACDYVLGGGAPNYP